MSNFSLPIDAANINEDINEFRADFIVLHLHRVRVCGNVDLADHVKQESFLYLWVAYQVVYHRWNELHLREELLDHFWESFIYGMVVNRSKVEAEGDLKVDVVKVLLHNALNVIETTHLLVFAQEHICVYLVNEDFK